MSTPVLGSNSFLVTPDVNGVLVLTTATGAQALTGTTNQIAISGTLGSPIIGLANNPILPGLASLTLPVGATADRPVTPTTGMLRFNTTTGQYEVYDTAWLSLSGILDKSTVQVTQTSLVAANLISYSVPANTLGTAGILRFKTGGTWARTAGTGALTFTISYGGTNLWVGTSGTMTTGNTTAWTIEVDLIANNSATAQTMSGIITINTTAAPTTGIGGIPNSNTSPFTASPIAGSSAVASTSAQTFQVSVVATLATSTLIKYFHTLELL
jgi:hypothetical protein